MNPFGQVSIIGVGLLGASLAKTMRKLGLAKSFVGFGRNRTSLNEAKNMGIIDKVAPDILSAAKDADLIVLWARTVTS